MERLLRHHVGLTEVWQINSPSARPLCRVPVSSLIYARALTDGFRDLEDSLGFRVAPSRNTEHSDSESETRLRSALLYTAKRIGGIA